MAKSINLNLAALAEEALLRRVKENAADAIMDKLVQEFKSKAQPIVRAEVEKLTLGTIKHMRDVAGMRDLVNVSFTYKE